MMRIGDPFEIRISTSTWHGSSIGLGSRIDGYVNAGPSSVPTGDVDGEHVGRSPNMFESAISISRSTEVRWFIRGPGPQLPNRCRSFIDSYSCELLAGSVSAKLRDGDASGAFLKIRAAVHPPVTFGDVTGTPETWLRIEPERISWNPHGDRFEVRKKIFRHNGIEVAHLEFGTDSWWSLAIRAKASGFPLMPREIANHIHRRGITAVSCSYPTWLIKNGTPKSAVSRACGNSE
jgi:hypothetical protein